MSEKVVTIVGRQIELRVERDGTRFRSGGQEIEVVEVRPHEAEIRAGGRTFVVPFALDGTTISFLFDGDAYTAEVAEKGARIRARHRDHSMAAPMPGLILKILVRPGDVVVKGAPLLVLEAMKMEHAIIATHAGTVASINCREGELVQPGLELVTMKDA
ncbi:MAG TPA: biotin/lipoyl-containing protein [Thermoanaerobaculia bacterium]|nr:biotin/lipoyl-containing protein [Thermoanaerobaculia bacterium]